MIKKFFKKKKKISKKDKNFLSEIKYLRERLDRAEKIIESKEEQITYFMKFFDNRIELVLSGKSEN